MEAGAGADTLWGGAGDDSLDLGTDSDADLIGFVDGNGNDTVTGFDYANDKMDLTAFGFASVAEVQSKMSSVDSSTFQIELSDSTTVLMEVGTGSDGTDWLLI